jgi:hypothetical protein
MTKPEVQTVAVRQAGGGVTVMRVVEGFEPITPDYVNYLIGQHIAGGNWVGDHAPVDWEFVPNDYVDENTDRTYRNAWVHEHGKAQKKPNHDMPKAREIQRVYLRKARMAEFCRLDNEYRIADEAGDVALKTELARQRQAFRDVTEDPRIEAAQTVEELKTLRLDVLLPDITKGEKYMDKLRVSSNIT